MMGQLENKVAVITGGGTGIGRETALLFAKEGAKVVVTDINEQAAATTGEDIGELSGGQDTALHIKHDVSKEEDWVTVVDESVRTFGKIDVLFNNAGIYIIKPLVETTLEDWNRLADVHQRHRRFFGHETRYSCHGTTWRRIRHQRFIGGRSARCAGARSIRGQQGCSAHHDQGRGG